MSQNALTIHVAQPPAVRAAATWLQKQQAAIARRLAPGMDGERYAALMLTEIAQNDRLLECFESEKGLATMQVAVHKMASLALEPGPLGHAYLVPFRQTKERYTACTFILGWRGMVQLALRSPKVRDVDLQPVYADDEFEWERGTRPGIMHRPVYDGPPDFERLTHVYAVCHTTTGGTPFVVLSKPQVLHYRKLSKQPDGFGWRDHPVPMSLKTAARRGFPFWPVRIVDAIEVEHDEERERALDGEVEGDAAAPAAGAQEPRRLRAAQAATRATPPDEPAPPPSGRRTDEAQAPADEGLFAGGQP